jgi:soluble lytic murein transglycosylase-like protein
MVPGVQPIQRIRNRSGGGRSVATALLAFVVTVAGGTLAIDHDAEALDSDGTLAAQNREAAERDAILLLVRSHRRTASEKWRRTLADAIYEESVAAEIDPLMVASIVARESSFKSQIVSRHVVARDVARRKQIDWKGRATLMSPTLNVRLGILYYQELMDRFEGDRLKALTAYNYGPTRVSRQIRDGVFDGSVYAERIIDLYSDLDTERQEST